MHKSFQKEQILGSVHMVTDSLNYLRGRRMWLAPDYNVWGLPASAEVTFVSAQSIDGTTRLFYDNAQIGGAEQVVSYSELTDHRGNTLPAQIQSPKVIALPRSAEKVFIVGRESGAGFKIARESSASGPVIVDLLIVEMS
jgi:hypothetical protein